jgi:hypothetical protein
MFFKSFFKKFDLVLNVKILISKESSFQVISPKKAVSDKDLIMLAVLFYARILRIYGSKEEKKDLSENFLIWYGSFEEQKYNKEFIELMLNNYGTVIYYPSKIFTKTKEIKMNKVEEGNFYLDVGVIYVDPISSIVYHVFKFVWNSIDSSNKKKLIEAYSLLSAEFIAQGLSIITAVNSPNEIVNDLFES